MAKKKNTTEKAHALYGPSSAERWYNCAASTEHEKTAPPEKESPYAKEGTDAHYCLETLMRADGKKLKEARIFLEGSYPSEMVEHATEAYFEIKRRQAELPGSVLYAEEKVDTSHFTDKDQFGTLDAAIVQEFGRLVVIDFKYGAGIPVDPDENKQLICYALAVAKRFHYNFVDVELVIIQPRARHESGNTVRSWTCSIEELIAWEPRFLERVAATKDPLAAFTAGPHCKFCRGKANCPEISSSALRAAQIVFDDGAAEIVSMPEPSKAGIMNLPKTLEACDRLEVWIEAVRAHAFYTLSNGESVPGWKLVPKRATRRWADPEKATELGYKLLGPKALQPKELKSPAQLEDTFKGDAALKKFIEKHAVSVSSGLTMVAESDRRPAVNPIEIQFPDKVEVLHIKVGKKKGRKKK